MKPVVIRCPNCGTTQGELGTCDTCHEAEAGYFCPNHAPGRWIDRASCDACGARVGVEAPPATGPVSTPRGPSAPTERGPVEWRPPARPREGGTRAGGPRPGSSARPPRHRPDELDDPGRGDPLDAPGLDPRLAELLEHMRRARGIPGRPTGAEPGPFGTIDPAAAARGVARGAIGCVGRLVMLFVILAILAMLALGGFFGFAYSDGAGLDVRASAEYNAAPAPTSTRRRRWPHHLPMSPALTRFTSTLFRIPGKGGWTFAPVPDECAPPARLAWGRTPVVATVDGQRWKTSVWREKSGRTLLPVPKAIRGGKGDGDAVAVTLEFTL